MNHSLPEVEAILDQAQALGVAEHIYNAGPVHVADMPTLYQDCHISFMPTLLETASATYPESVAMGLPVVSNEAHGLLSIGPESVGNRALTTAVAPYVVLPDLEGNPFHLSSLKGQNIVVFAWAPY